MTDIVLWETDNTTKLESSTRSIQTLSKVSHNCFLVEGWKPEVYNFGSSNIPNPNLTFDSILLQISPSVCNFFKFGEVWISRRRSGVHTNGEIFVKKFFLFMVGWRRRIFIVWTLSEVVSRGNCIKGYLHIGFWNGGTATARGPISPAFMFTYKFLSHAVLKATPPYHYCRPIVPESYVETVLFFRNSTFSCFSVETDPNPATDINYKLVW